ncbi:MAG TPA: DNA polymerase III subunit alpha, partial [bacterium]|nr:DNA polymerase III subunit alpha [bacterium]
NKSHATAYATIAYQTAYLKAHFPVEFMAALLTSEKNDTERISKLIGECKKMGIEVLPPDINESFRNFSVIPKKKKIRFGLLAIKNVGQNVVESIIREREERGPFRSISDFVSRIDGDVLNKKSLESLIKAGVLDSLGERNRLLASVEKILITNREIRRLEKNGQKNLFGRSFHSACNFKLEDAKPISLQEKLIWEKELLGLYVSAHPLENFKNILKNKVLPIKEISERLWGQRIKIGGIISGIKKIITRNGKPMLFVKVEDLEDKIEVVVFPNIIEQNPTAFQENKIVMITGRVDQKDQVPKIICDSIEEIIEEKKQCNR